MVKSAAQMIGILTAILLIVVWIVLSGSIPYEVGLGVNIVVILGSALAGLIAYVTVMKNNMR